MQHHLSGRIIAPSPILCNNFPSLYFNLNSSLSRIRCRPCARNVLIIQTHRDTRWKETWQMISCGEQDFIAVSKVFAPPHLSSCVHLRDKRFKTMSKVKTDASLHGWIPLRVKAGDVLNVHIQKDLLQEEGGNFPLNLFSHLGFCLHVPSSAYSTVGGSGRERREQKKEKLG